MTPGRTVASAPTDFGVEPGARKPPQLLERFSRRPRAAVGADARDGVVGIGDVHDVRGNRDLVAAQAMRISASVRPFVVQLDNRQVGDQERHRLQDARARAGMLFDDRRTPRG